MQRALDEVGERTARKLAEDALLASNERHRTMLRTAMDGFWVVDMRGHLLEVNETYCRMSGYSEQESLTMSIHDLEAVEETGETAARIQKILTCGEDRFDSRHRRKDGSIFDVAASVQYRPADGGQMVVFLQDISEHRKLEEQLRQSQKMEAIGQLAGGVAHDFNNILTVIMGYCNLLNLRPTFVGRDKDALEHINSAAEKAAQLTRGLLAFSRKQVMDPQPVNLNDIVLQVQKFLDRIIGEDIKLRAVFNESTLRVMADAGQIEQVLMNLAANARDAMHEGGELTIETYRKEIDDSFVHCYNCGKPGSYALISVTDTGCGMDEGTRCRVFEPFFTTKEVGKGTGLGMAIVHGIVNQHNGFIHVYSEPGKGTIFKLYIPLMEPEDISKSEPIEDVPPRGGTETILVVEDDFSVRTVIETLLLNSGYEIITAEDGQDAIEKFSENRARIKLILMDMVMPKKSGLEAYKEIKSLQNNIRVLFTSGYTADFIRSRGELDNGVDLIIKPAKPSELLRKIRELLDSKEVDR
jgi:polar amino acid transport system substrate-binding protein